MITINKSRTRQAFTKGKVLKLEKGLFRRRFKHNTSSTVSFLMKGGNKTRMMCYQMKEGLCGSMGHLGCQFARRHLKIRSDQDIGGKTIFQEIVCKSINRKQRLLCGLIPFARATTWSKSPKKVAPCTGFEPAILGLAPQAVCRYS